MPAGSIWALFSNSFLAATILPIGSEPLLIYLLGQGMDPWQLLLWASLGNIAGAMVNYLLGRLGSEPLFRKVLRMSPEEVEGARTRFQRFGAPALLLAWVPVIGDPLTVVAGLGRINPLLFVLLVSIGKVGRYAVIIWGWPLLSAV